MYIFVIVPALNEETELPKFFDSLREQKTDFSFSVVIIDNNSTDNTAAVARSYSATVISCKEQGIGPARATGVNYVLEKFQEDCANLLIVQLDADEVLDPGYIQAVGEAFIANPHLMVSVGPTIYTFMSDTEKKIISTGKEFRNTFQIEEMKDLFSRHSRDIADYIITPRCRHLIGGNTAYRASVFSLPHVGYSQGNGWESVVISVRLHQVISDDGFGFVPEQKVYTSARAYSDEEGIITKEKIEHIKKLGYIPPFKLHQAISPAETAKNLIHEIEKELYQLAEDEYVSEIIYYTEGTHPPDEVTEKRLLPALHAATKQEISNKFVVIGKRKFS